MKKILFSHPTGNANARAAVMGLYNKGILKGFYTSIAAFPQNFFDKIGNLSFLSDFKKRSYNSSLQQITTQYPFGKLGRMIATKAKLSSLIKHETGFFSIDHVYKTLDNKIATVINKNKIGEIDAVYSYEDGAAYSFKAAKQYDVKCFYDLPIGYWRSMRNMLKDERSIRPLWANTITGFSDSDRKLDRKDEEIRLSDCIFVASSFTRNTLNSFPGNLPPVYVVPYGFPEVNLNRVYEPLVNRKLKLLFVGGLSQRKGIANLFEAIEGMEDRVELTVVGNKSVENCDPLNMALKKHKWIPTMPHGEILNLMSTQDVFVFPSLFEGFGLVITEAMSQGTPVITTERTAGPDLIEHNKNGWLVTAGDTGGLKKAIENLLNFPEAIQTVGRAALKTAQQRPWEVYGNELSTIIASFK